MTTKRKRSQYVFDFDDEIIVDLFAGGGGMSTAMHRVSHAGYIECLHQAGDDTMCVITGEANAARLSREESKRLLVWHQADPMLREAAWRVLVTNSDD